MATVLNPYLSFDGNAREAMQTYQALFGGSLAISTFGEMGAPDPSVADKVMHANLQGDNGLVLMGADTPPEMTYNPGSSFAVSLGGDDSEQLHRFWDGLSAGGQIQVPLEKQMWGDVFGMCVDRFGIPWMVNISVPAA